MLIRRASALLIACLVLACSETRPPATPTLVFTAIPDQDETRLRAKFEPIARYLAQALDIPVTYLPATSYDDAVEHFKNGDVQLAWFGGLSGVRTRRAVPGARAIAQGAEDPEFYSYFIAHKDSGLEPSDSFPTGLAGKTFTFGPPGSTSGRLMPEHFIREHTGQSPAALFGRENAYATSHDETLKRVQSGAFAAGAVSYTTYDTRVAEGTIDPDVCRVIWKTPTYADYNFTAHPMLETTFGPGFFDRLQRALLAMRDPELLSAFPRSRLIPANNADFAVIEKLAEELGFVDG